MTALAALIRKSPPGFGRRQKGHAEHARPDARQQSFGGGKSGYPAKNELSADDAAVLQEYLNRHTRKDDE